MRKLILLAMVVALAACAGTATPNIPSSSDVTVEPTVTPSDDMADEATSEATADMTAEMTADATQPVNAEGTQEVAMNPTFRIDITGDTEITIDSDDAEVMDEMNGSPAQGEAAPLMNTPNVMMRTLRFVTGDQTYIFELSFSQNTITVGEYEIGTDNVNTSIGNNANENAAGELQNAPQPSASSTSEATDEPAAGTSSSLNTPSATQVNNSANNAGSSLSSNDVPSSGPGQGVIETDETFAPIISARLIPDDPEAVEYNLLQSGTLTIDSIQERGVSGSFQFVLSPADNPDQTITVNGTFIEIPFTETDEESLTPVP